MPKHKSQRVGIFIDVQNLYHSAKNLYKARVNFKELVKNLTAGRQLIRPIAYVVKTEATEGESAFFDALKQAGIELRMKDIQVFPGGMKKADWDVGMAVDTIRMASFLDVIILVTGDGDFVPLVEYLQWGLGRVVEVAAFSRTANAKLKEEADQFIAIEDVPRALIKK
ncbi:MAG: NYN domain-containing protein [Candidatus Harrisonbacteria bacterium]|nr:NYN domain-containing protein [Candidatus Harrisonbacteria bacterium]